MTAFARAFQPANNVGLVVEDMGARILSWADGRGQAWPGCATGLPGRVHRPQPERNRAGPALRRLRLPGAPVPRRGLRLARRRGHGLRPAGDRHRRGAGARLRHGRDGLPDPSLPGEFAECRVDCFETIGRPWLHEPDVDVLVNIWPRGKRPRRSTGQGDGGKPGSASRFTWARTAEAAERRLSR